MSTKYWRELCRSKHVCEQCDCVTYNAAFSIPPHANLKLYYLITVFTTLAILVLSQNYLLDTSNNINEALNKIT